MVPISLSYTTPRRVHAGTVSGFDTADRSIPALHLTQPTTRMPRKMPILRVCGSAPCPHAPPKGALYLTGEILPLPVFPYRRVKIQGLWNLNR
jgi:hypothetical protein